MAEDSELHRQAAVSSTLFSGPGIFPISDVLCWSPEQENLDLQIKIVLSVFNYRDSEGSCLIAKYWITNMTTFVESVGPEPQRGHPPAALLFSASQDHTDLYLLPGLVQNPKGRYNKN